MNTKIRLLPAWIAAACAFSTVPVYAKGIGVHRAKVYSIQDEAARILKNIEEQAYDLHDHALTLNAATGIQTLEREFFVEQMSAVRQDVNTMGAEITRLEALAESGSEAQRDAVAKAKPQLEAIAAQTTAGIRYLDEHPDRLQFPEYRKITASLASGTETLWRQLHDTDALASVSRREQRLRSDLAKTEGTKN